MTEYIERFNNVLEMLRSFLDLEVDNTYILIIWTAVFLFGIINCILGYRLLRFWMMLFGFAAGAAAGYFASVFAGVASLTTRGIISLAMGAAAAILVFLIYNAGIFVIGAAIGFLASVYLIHPTSSEMFFLCIVIGVVLGVIALKFRKIVLIVATSAIGGVLAGVSLAKILGYPYLQISAIAFFIVGILLQLVINRDDEEEEEEIPEEINTRDSDYLGLFDSEDDDDREQEYPYVPNTGNKHRKSNKIHAENGDYEMDPVQNMENQRRYQQYSNENRRRSSVETDPTERKNRKSEQWNTDSGGQQRELYYYDLKREKELTERQRNGQRSKNKRNEDA